MNRNFIKILAFIFSLYLIIPNVNVSAETLKDYKNILQKYKNEQSQNQAQINQADRAIENNREEITKITKEIQKMDSEIENMRGEITEYNSEIKEKSLETKQLFSYLQVAQSENLYLEYAFDADTITDLIYRISVVEQLTKYNESKISELEKMIKHNQDREVELQNLQVEMEKKQGELSAAITKLTGVKASLNENSISVSQQIKIYEDIVKGYENAGCKDNDVIGVNCATTNNVAGWYRPVDNGYVTSEFGYRWGSLHRAVDLSNKNPYSTKIYPVANGTITSIYKDYYGALTLTIEHKTSNGKYYSSLYTHLSKYAPGLYVGKKVTSNDYIGYMGATGYATGPHLHFEITPCRIFNQYDANCSTWNKYTAYMAKIYGNKTFGGPRDFIYFPNPYVTFNGR